jgi:hypothetical protein
VTTPAFDDDDLRFPQCVEDFTVEQLVAEAGIKLSMNPYSQELPGVI